jgi:hypothetical protein
VLRVLEKLGDGGLFDDATAVHHNDTVRHLGNDAEVVGDKEK